MTAIRPDGLSVVEVADITANRRADISGNWMFKDGTVIKRIYTAEELQQQGENRKARLLADAESVILPLERAVRLNMATDEERSRLEAWNATVFWSVVWILQILNGRKYRNKLYELWCELTYLWHRVKPNLTVRSVP